jgi:DNA replication protein DnaC
MLVTANQPFGEWGKVFPAMTLAAIDRLVHHSTIFEIKLSGTVIAGRDQAFGKKYFLMLSPSVLNSTRVPRS